MYKISLYKLSKFLDALSPIYKLIIAKVVFDVTIIAMLMIAKKISLIILVFAINLTIALLYLISLGEAKFTIGKIFEFMFKGKTKK